MAGNPRICLVQTSLEWENPPANLDHFAGQLEAVGDTDLIVLPEMFSTGFSMNSMVLAETMDGDTISWMKSMARMRQSAICGSVIIRDDGNYYNRFVVAFPSEDLVYYDKRHLFRMSSENDNYSPGSERVTFSLGDVTMFPQVCYDLRFPVFSRNDLGFDVMIYVANWPGARQDHWRTLLAARAIENQCYVVGVNRIGVDGNGVEYAGDSGVVDFTGDWLVAMGNGDSSAVARLDMEHLRAYRRQFPAWKDADRFSLDLPP